MIARLDALGIRPGKQITKLTQMPLRGPVTVAVERSQIAIGYNMASRIMVTVENP